MFLMILVVGLFLFLLLTCYSSRCFSSSVIDTNQKFVQTVPLYSIDVIESYSVRFLS